MHTDRLKHCNRGTCLEIISLFVVSALSVSFKSASTHLVGRIEGLIGPQEKKRVQKRRPETDQYWLNVYFICALKTKSTAVGHRSCCIHVAKKRMCGMVDDSHFLRSKSTKCMEIVSNAAIMDVSHTMGSYGPSSVFLAVIAAQLL